MARVEGGEIGGFERAVEAGGVAADVEDAGVGDVWVRGSWADEARVGRKRAARRSLGLICGILPGRAIPLEHWLRRSVYGRFVAGLRPGFNPRRVETSRILDAGQT